MPLSGQPKDVINIEEPPRKRVRTTSALQEGPSLTSLRASISPPSLRSAKSVANLNVTEPQVEPITPGTILSSPIKLTRIRDLPGALNKGCLSLSKIVCDPMIAEIWEFNYMHDLDFLMSNLDPDTKDLMKIHVVHGYWKAESGVQMKVSIFVVLYLDSCLVLANIIRDLTRL